MLFRPRAGAGRHRSSANRSRVTSSETRANSVILRRRNSGFQHYDNGLTGRHQAARSSLTPNPSAVVPEIA